MIEQAVAWRERATRRRRGGAPGLGALWRATRAASRRVRAFIATLVERLRHRPSELERRERVRLDAGGRPARRR